MPIANDVQVHHMHTEMGPLHGHVTHAMHASAPLQAGAKVTLYNLKCTNFH